MNPFFSDFEVEAPYVHSTGPAVGRFLESLKSTAIEGRRCEACAIVVVPPSEYCERCGEDLGEWTTVGPEGTVTASATEFAVIVLDGAGTGLVHRIEAGLQRGDRVHPHWAEQRTGSITDIERFEKIR